MSLLTQPLAPPQLGEAGVVTLTCSPRRLELLPRLSFSILLGGDCINACLVLTGLTEVPLGVGWGLHLQPWLALGVVRWVVSVRGRYGWLPSWDNLAWGPC